MTVDKHRTQYHRSRKTRHKLLEATLDCIFKYGYTATTTTVISEYAGVSRGAMLHHYPTRMTLIIAATEHLFALFAEDVAEMASRFSNSPEGMNDFIEGVWAEMFNGRFFFVSLELIVISRSDPELKGNLEPLIKYLHTRLDATWRDFFTESELAPARVDTLLNMTLCLMRGMAVQSVLRQDPVYYSELLNAWKSSIGGLLNQSSSDNQ